MKHLFLIGIISLTGIAAQAGPTCAEYFKYRAQGIDWPYAMPMSDFVANCKLSLDSNKKWPPVENECPQPQEHFAVVTEHIQGTNNTIYCKLNIIEENLKSSIEATRHINCTNASIEIGSLVLINDAYHKMWDKMGNIMCFNITSLIKVIGKVPYQ